MPAYRIRQAAMLDEAQSRRPLWALKQQQKSTKIYSVEPNSDHVFARFITVLINSVAIDRTHGGACVRAEAIHVGALMPRPAQCPHHPAPELLRPASARTNATSRWPRPECRAPPGPPRV